MRVPPVVVAGSAGPGMALIASRMPSGQVLAEVDPSSITDAMLDDLWKQVAALHAARVAHGRLNANHVVVDGDSVTSDAKALGNVTVTAEVVDHTKGPKIVILKYKNKTGYRKRQGHRQRHSRVKVTGIETGK